MTLLHVRQFHIQLCSSPKILTFSPRYPSDFEWLNKLCRCRQRPFGGGAVFISGSKPRRRYLRLTLLWKPLNGRIYSPESSGRSRSSEQISPRSSSSTGSGTEFCTNLVIVPKSPKNWKIMFRLPTGWEWWLHQTCIETRHLLTENAIVEALQQSKCNILCTGNYIFVANDPSKTGACMHRKCIGNQMCLGDIIL